ncbi:hypothetical protein [Burkholderia diffusa]|uniref:GTP pyrophosphokinase n=1 Tax=Burkholderia diffusa TaxID=488732 RepID=UPI002ABE9F49|nr:hypothetical protein [Burkholderia diffusa]
MGSHPETVIKLVPTLLDEYDKSKEMYASFGKALEGLVRQLLEHAGIRVLDVTHRIKDRESVKNKIARKSQGKYRGLRDMTDVCGLRVITYFEDDVKRVCDIIESEFEIDRDNSIDKSATLEHDQFGYRSVHYVVSNGRVRSGLVEYSKFNLLSAEIQVRSILQHAWAEIEHDLGYKTAEAVPLPVKRQFSRLAGLLELGDQEFTAIRDLVKDYVGQLPSKLNETPSRVEIDAESLLVFVNTDPLVNIIDMNIAALLGVKLVNSASETAGRRVAPLRMLSIVTIEQLSEALRENEDVVPIFAKRWVSFRKNNYKDEEPSVDFTVRGISIFYLLYLLFLRDDRPGVLAEYLKGNFFPNDALEDDLKKVYSELPKSQA